MARKITLNEFLKGRKPESPEIEANCNNTITLVNVFLESYTGDIIVNSGLRDPGSNRAAGGAINSTHLTGQAIDLSDKDGKIKDFVLANLQLAKDLGLWFEDFRWTNTWAHMQTKPPKSGKRIYIPNTNPPIDSTRWNGKYDKKFD